ncbi:1247_t:CDS:1, partial [Funneliformis mosseae]
LIFNTCVYFHYVANLVGENSSQKLLRRFYINLNRRTVVNDIVQAIQSK